MKSKLILILSLIFTYASFAADYRVSSASDISTTMSKALPGDTLTMTDGVWQDQFIVFSGNGEADKPILLRAETPGFVNLTGTSALRIGGKYLIVDGLRFVGGNSNSGAIIEFRNGGTIAHNCRLTNTAIINYNPASVNTEYKWVSIYGTYNEVDHCYFTGKRNYGALLVVWRNYNAPDYHHIHHNYFYDRPLTVNDNGFETIRLGTSDLSLSDSYSIVESNYFEKCNGEIEIISNKSGENIYRYNTFYNCEGTLTLRHGNKCQVYSNYFDGQGNDKSGGIRVIGQDHTIYNNYFSNLGGNGSRSALSLENGVPDSPLNRYFQVINARVVNNTFVNNYSNIILGTGKSTERSLPPLDCTIANNIVSGSHGPLIDKDDDPINLTWLANIFYGASLGIIQPEGIAITDPLLAVSSDGIFRPGEGSPAIDAANTDFVFVDVDFDAQPRSETPDIGSDEASIEPVLRRPVTVDSVGPDWLNSVTVPMVLSARVEGSGKIEADPAGGLYDYGTWVKLTVIPAESWIFAGWEGDLSGNSSEDSILMDSDKSVIARFDPPVSYEIAFWIVGNGTVISDPPGPKYIPGTLVRLTAAPSDGWAFSGWGGAISGKSNPDSVLVNANIGIMATFSDITGIEDAKISYNYHLSQNYPNPFNPRTIIEYGFAQPGMCTIEIYNSAGRHLDTILEKYHNPGQYKVEYDASGLASGIYYYRLRSKSYSQMRKMILLK